MQTFPEEFYSYMHPAELAGTAYTPLIIMTLCFKPALKNTAGFMGLFLEECVRLATSAVRRETSVVKQKGDEESEETKVKLEF